MNNNKFSKNNFTPNKTIRVCMTGTWLSSSNVGDQAILLGVLHSLRNRSEVAITVFTSNPERVKREYNIDALRFKSNPFKFINKIRKSDVFLFTGGTPFYDDLVHMLYFLFLAISAKIFGVPIVIFGISVRSMDKVIPKICLMLIGNLSSYFGIREYDSELICRKILLYRDHHKIRLLPDLAIQIPGPYNNYEIIDEIKRKNIIDSLDNYVVICPRSFESNLSFSKNHYNEKYNEKDLKNYYNTLRELTIWIASQSNMNVIFLPMHIHFPDADTLVGNEILKSIKNSELRKKIFVIQKQYDPIRAMSLFSKAQYVIGVRFHSVLLSLISNTPVISIGYAKKNESIMKLFNLNQYAYSIKDINFKLVQQSIIELEKNKCILKNRMLIQCESLKKCYNEELNFIFSFIKQSE